MTKAEETRIAEKKGYRKSPNYIHSILTMKCPVCRTGKLFKKKWPNNFSELTDMHEHCEVCGNKTEFEPGFYYGSMYAAYAITVAIFVTIWVAYTVLVGSVFDNVALFFAIDIPITLLMMPLTFRLARSLWAHLFMKYRGN